MKKIFEQLSQLIHRQLKFIWILGTILILLASLYINANLSDAKSYKELSNIATNMSNNLDGFIEDLFQEIYTLPVYGKNISECSQNITPYLQHIVINNPKISGLMISDSKSQLICSTLPNNNSYFSKIQHGRTISGPFSINIFEQPVYFFQQKIGHYLIGIVVASPALEQVLHSQEPIVDSIALYNQLKKKNNMRIEQDKQKNGWVISKELDYFPANKIFALNKIHSINDLIVVVYENKKTAYYYLLLTQSLMGIALLLCSWLLYFLTRHLMNERYSLRNAMKQAIKNKRFYPVYQPLFDKVNHTYTGAEVLLRWQDYQDEIIMPDFFIEEAESTGLIVPITLQIVETAFQETKKIVLAYPNFHIAFNLSALHFTDVNFFNKFYQLTEQYNILPHQILFEITERDLLNKNNSIFVTRMQDLIDKGYSLAVDDYGTGHASISYLQNFPFNYLKIDQIFVQAIGTKAINESLINTIISMAKRLNLTIIAEGVETEEQVHYLSKNGVQFLQGWYFSKALRIEQLMELLTRSNNESLH